MVHFDLQRPVRVGSVVTPVVVPIASAANHVRGYAVGVSVWSTVCGVEGRPLGEGQAACRWRAPDAHATHDCSLVDIVPRPVALENMAAVVGHVSHVYAGL